MWNSCVRVHWQRSSTIGNLFKSPISHCCLRCNFLANGSVGGASSSCYHSIRGTKMRSFIFFFGIILLNCNQATLGFGLLGSTLKVSLDWKEWRHPKEQGASIQSRKQFLDDSKCLVFGAMTGILLPESSVAAAPVTDKETDSLGVMARRALRPKPPKVLRRKLSQDFAVLLMRSSYNALDGLNCVAMDQFQRDFFLIRRSEYEPYTKALGPGMVQQGDLTDPYYFDFISFTQYETMNREITQDPPFVFEEQQPVDEGEDRPQKFVPVVIRRDPALTNERLGPEHSRMVGEAILDRLDETFGSTESSIPAITPDSRPGGDTLVASLRQLVNLFLVNGYAMGGSVSVSEGNKLLISLSSPVTLWGGKILQSERAKLNNNFLLKAAIELIRRAGYSTSSSIEYDGSKEEITITFT